jgi:hypothetical protein
MIRSLRMSVLLLGIVMISSLSSLSVMANSPMSMAPSSCIYNTTAGYQNRLPSTSYPQSYAIRLQLFPNNNTIAGGLDITLTVSRSTSCIVLGSAFLQISEVPRAHSHSMLMRSFHSYIPILA